MFKSNSGSSSIMHNAHDASFRAVYDAPVRASMLSTYASYALLGFACALPIIIVLCVL